MVQWSGVEKTPLSLISSFPKKINEPLLNIFLTHEWKDLHYFCGQITTRKRDCHKKCHLYFQPEKFLCLTIERPSIADPTVSNGSVASDTSVAVVNTGDNSSGATVGHLANSVSVSLALAVVAVAVARVADPGDNTSIVRVSGGISIGQGKTKSHLSDGVSISLTLSIVAVAIARVANSGDNADIVGMASGIGIGYGEAIGHLPEGVGIRIPLDSGNSQKNLRGKFISFHQEYFGEILTIAVALIMIVLGCD